MKKRVRNTTKKLVRSRRKRRRRYYSRMPALPYNIRDHNAKLFRFRDFHVGSSNPGVSTWSANTFYPANVPSWRGGVAHTPPFWDTYNQIYNKYAVLSCRMMVRFSWTESSDCHDMLIADVCTDENDDWSNFTTENPSHEQAVLDPRLRTRVWFNKQVASGTTTGRFNNQRSIVLKKTIKPVNWCKNKHTVIENEELEGTMDGVTEPTKDVEWQVALQHAFDDTGDPPNIRVEQWIQWDVFLYDMQDHSVEH